MRYAGYMWKETACYRWNGSRIPHRKRFYTRLSLLYAYDSSMLFFFVTTNVWIFGCEQADGVDIVFSGWHIILWAFSPYFMYIKERKNIGNDCVRVK